MDPQKLFRVLVVGGALLVGCREEERADAGPAVDAGATDDGGGLVECGFCPNTECCVTEPTGESHERPGMMCCWSTSC